MPCCLQPFFLEKKSEKLLTNTSHSSSKPLLLVRHWPMLEAERFGIAENAATTSRCLVSEAPCLGVVPPNFHSINATFQH